jgi:hypothetical protein
LLITPKQQHGKNQNKMDFVVVRTKITKNKIGFFFSYAWVLVSEVEAEYNK